MNQEERWFKKKNPFQVHLYWIMGKFIISIEVLLYILSMKCVLVDIIPKRLNTYFDFPITCIILMGYLLTFRSLYLASVTDCGTQITSKNYLKKEQHEDERKKKEKIEAEKKEKAQKEKDEKKQMELAKKAKKSSCLCRRRQKQKQIQVSNTESDSQIDSSNHIKTAEKNNKNEKTKANKKQQQTQTIIGEVNQTEHSEGCKHQNCDQHQHNKGNEIDKIKSKICLKCNIVKEKHDHHCSMCNKCVYRLDHHCFFIGQCVGDYNYLYFISYVFLSYVMTMIVLLCIIPDVIDFFLLQWDKLSSSFVEIFILLLGGILFHFFTMILLISHLYYISNEVTYLENLHNMKKKEYSALEWVCIIIKCQSRAKLYDTFTARWHQIFGNLNFTSIIYPEGTKIKLD
ncbi:DHHC zinc finger protein (macronuclear) [Tetrahymena thermophila SB210]|uniref:Palmitoyltransferase n=1 Tax=Tetrahymena thermophila (strain SB210) TaxID=312017 RepID=I7MAT4_TETTS|nr:DHHC zinc finger protein [Tetrahymena thermophila SB210]EAS06107.1 DHHC zinc finger protein [Tetrahymena thermophila SB210]|eukprot:XP_001026352.1 DHHC zinc finger protein [Tetrahymena thermophila SB210]